MQLCPLGKDLVPILYNTKKQKKQTKLEDENFPHHLDKIDVWILHLNLYIYSLYDKFISRYTFLFKFGCFKAILSPKIFLGGNRKVVKGGFPRRIGNLF